MLNVAVNKDIYQSAFPLISAVNVDATDNAKVDAYYGRPLE
jgi:hypothetical protein